MEILLHRATQADGEFLERMFVEAVLWRPEWPKVELHTLLGDPRLAAHFSGWGRDGDEAWTATEGSTPVGAAWLRRFTADAPGYGFVDEDTPAIGIAVHSGSVVRRVLL